jgi:hypothetical protein
MCFLSNKVSSSTLLLFVCSSMLLSCSPSVKQPTQTSSVGAETQSQPTTSATATSDVAVAEVVSDIPVSTENDIFSEYSEFVLACNDQELFNGIQFVVQCPIADEDKDGRPDFRGNATPLATIELTNNTIHPINLTFAGLVKPFNNEEDSHLYYEKGVSDLASTVKFQPNETITLDNLFFSFDDVFPFAVGLGKVEFPEGEIETLSISCPTEYLEERIFGVTVGMDCNGGKLRIDNQAVDSRGFRATPNFASANIVYSNPQMRTGMFGSVLVDFPWRTTADVKLEIVIP